MNIWIAHRYHDVSQADTSLSRNDIFNVFLLSHSFVIPGLLNDCVQLLPEKYSYFRRVDRVNEQLGGEENAPIDCVICMAAVDVSQRCNDCMVCATQFNNLSPSIFYSENIIHLLIFTQLGRI